MVDEVFKLSNEDWGKYCITQRRAVVYNLTTVSGSRGRAEDVKVSLSVSLSNDG